MAPNESVSLASCSTRHQEMLCEHVMTSLHSNGALNSIDLNNMTQAGWIWAEVTVFTPLCVFGIIGNILTILMFARYIKKTTTSVFIIALAIVDLTVCSISMPIWLYTLLNQHHGANIICGLDKFITFLAITASTGILLVIAIDRFLLIFVSKTAMVIIITKARAKIIVLIVGVICFAAAIPQPLSFTTIYDMNPDLSGMYCEGEIKCNSKLCLPTNKYISFEVGYQFWRVVMYSYFVIVFAFIGFYSLIFVKVYKMHKKMVVYKSSHHRPTKTSADKQKIAEENGTFAILPDTQTSNKAEIPESQNLLAAKDKNLHLTIRENNSDSEGMITEEVSLAKANAPPVLRKINPASTHAKKKRLPHLHTAITLFLVTITFILAYAPMILMMVLGSCSKLDDEDTTEHSFVSCSKNSYQYLVWHFYFLSHVTNPIIYSFMNPRFKEVIRKYCRKGCLCQS